MQGMTLRQLVEFLQSQDDEMLDREIRVVDIIYPAADDVNNLDITVDDQDKIILEL